MFSLILQKISFFLYRLIAIRNCEVDFDIKLRKEKSFQLKIDCNSHVKMQGFFSQPVIASCYAESGGVKYWCSLTGQHL